MLKRRDYPSAMWRFETACTKESKRVIGEIGDANHKLFQSIAELFSSEEGTMPNPKHKLSPEQTFFRQLFFDYIEVRQAYETLSDFPALSQSRPPRNSKLSSSRLLVFWREAYLNEFYIFQCRLEVFIKRIARAYRKDFPSLTEKNVSEVIKTLNDSFLQPITKLRGIHVHIHRSQHSDPELIRLELLDEWLDMLGVDGKNLYKKCVNQCRKHNAHYFRIFTSQAKNSLTVVFCTFGGVLFDADNNFIYPKNLKTTL